MQTATYAFDAVGNLTSRTGPETAGVAQTFSYDRVSRNPEVRG